MLQSELYNNRHMFFKEVNTVLDNESDGSETLSVSEDEDSVNATTS